MQSRCVDARKWSGGGKETVGKWSARVSRAADLSCPSDGRGEGTPLESQYDPPSIRVIFISSSERVESTPGMTSESKMIPRI